VWQQGHYYETKSQALYYCAALRKPDDLVRAWPIVLSWIDLVDNWDSSDDLSAVYSRILEVLPEKVYPVRLEPVGEPLEATPVTPGTALLQSFTAQRIVCCQSVSVDRAARRRRRPVRAEGTGLDSARGAGALSC